MTRFVHLVRHGEVHNPAGVVYGTLPGFRLSEQGRAHAQAAALQLRALVGPDEVPPCIVASPLERAQETAAEIAAAFGPAFAPASGEAACVRTDARLTEARSFAMGLPRSFAPRRYLERLLSKDRPTHEDPSHVVDRMLAAARAACGRHAHAILVSHQFPIWMARVGLEASLEQRARAWVARRAPWVLVRERCALGSITTIDLRDPRPETTRYWEGPGCRVQRTRREQREAT